MGQAVESILFLKDKARYNEIATCATQFNAVYNGNNIIQDDIFHIVENYTRKHGIPFELLRYPVADQELCACTFIRENRLFVFVNAAIPLAKQIFAVAHELFHIYRYVEGSDTELSECGSILNSSTLDEEATATEDMEANAFAGLLLAPADRISEQMRIYDIKRGEIALQDILMLMEIFAIPYKALVLRLFEEDVLAGGKIREFLSFSPEEIKKQADLTDRAARWLEVPKTPYRFGTLFEKIKRAEQMESVREERIQSDMEVINVIKKSIENL